MSAERTLMAYARAGISLVGVGFTMYQYLAVDSAARELVLGRGLAHPEWLGLGILIAGIIVLFGGGREYAAFVRDLKYDEFGPLQGLKDEHHFLGTRVAYAAVVIAGIAALVLTVFGA